MSSADWFHALADVAERPDTGGKARNLARLIAAGLPVPPGFVIDARAFSSTLASLGVTSLDERALDDLGHRFAHVASQLSSTTLPDDLVARARERAASLGNQLAVRSSATIEDRAAGAAAGLFSSVTAVPLAELEPAIRAVWSSALTPLVAAYARRGRGTDPLTPSQLSAGWTPSIAVIVQRFVPGDRVIVYTRRPGDPTGIDVLVQRDGALTTARRDGVDEIVTLALRAERAIEASTGADVEIVVGEETVVVQARPIVHPARAQTKPLPRALIAPLIADGREWKWDVAHNPDPLSTAQTELVALVEGVGTYALRVCGGYLYTTPRHAPEPPSLDKLADIERRMEEVLGEDTALSLDDALDRYTKFYSLWTRELSPLVYAERKKVRTFQSRPSSVEESLVAAAIGARSEDDVIAHLALLAPAWDVAVATFGERPEIVREAIARARIAFPPGSVSPFGTPDAIGADLGERDDRWFARAQWMVRRALLALGLGDDAFWIPFADLRVGIDAETARRRAAGARAAAARAADWEPPLVVHGEEAVRDIRTVLRGFGTGGRAVGRVVRLASLASAITVGRGDVVVTRAFTPALAVVVIGCAGLISESGELLDHASSMARELGIPAVVGCRDAWRSLDDGQIVEVDGDAGEVRPYSSSSS